MSILATIVAGAAGTALMTMVMTLIHFTGWARANMIRALGSFVTKSHKNSIVLGLLMHFGSGIVFAFPYAFVLSGLDLPTMGSMLRVGAIIGFVHGFVMSFVLVAMVAEKHPLEEFREVGFEVAVAHILGHVVYGVGVGALVSYFGVDFGITI